MREKQLQLTVGKPVQQDKIPAASGMAMVENRLFVVGDNSPLLFELDQQFNIVAATTIREYPVDDKGLIKKKNKPDFEAMANFHWQEQHWLLIIGSGSKPDVREWAFMICADDTSVCYEKKLTDLYRQFYAIGNLHGEQTLNIEGLTVADGQAYFFNRGNSARNMIFRTSLDDLISYITNASITIKIEHVTATLPSVDQYGAGFSGADFWPAAKALVYSASLEVTNDAYNDGEILGSYIGLIVLADWQDGETLDLSHSAQPLLQDGRNLIAKVEAVTLLEFTQHEAKAVLACDNDNGSSEFFTALLTLK
jgi:hypothetical protein